MQGRHASVNWRPRSAHPVKAKGWLSLMKRSAEVPAVRGSGGNVDEPTTRSRQRGVADTEGRADGTRPLTVRRLLDSAVRAFAEHGFEGTTTRQICAGAGLSSAALYVYFGSKEELLYEISMIGHEEALGVLREAVEKSGADPVERLRAAVHAFVLYHAEHYTLARVIQYELRVLSPEHLTTVLTIRREIHQALRSAIEAGVRAGRFACTDVGGSALAIESLAIDVSRWFDFDRSRWTPSELAAMYARFALRIVQSDSD